MKTRRDFITLLGTAAATWPMAARAQPNERIRRIGMLVNTAPTDAEGMTRAGVFKEGLGVLGWTVGSNLLIDLRWAPGTTAEARAIVRELIRSKPDVILAAGTPALQMIIQEAQSLPVVFVSVSDPVREGFVASLARPGGNITGFSQYEYTIGGKWLGLLKEIAPAVTKVLVILNAGNPASTSHLQTIESVAASFKVSVSHLAVRSATELESAMGNLRFGPDHGLVCLPGITNVVDRAQLIGLAAERRLPAVYSLRADAFGGGLMSYGVDVNDQYRRAALYVDRILKGERPADLPVQQPIKYELIINLKTAKLLKIEVPPGLSARADEIIE